MIWPVDIADVNGRIFILRPDDREAKGTFFYQADILTARGEEAGYFWFDDFGDDSIVLHDIEVYERYSGAGLGSRLIQIVEAEARRLGKAKIVGHVDARCQMSGQKERLAAWYRKRGYTVTQTDFSNGDYYGTLEKRLSS